MRKVAINKVAPGMVLGRTIYSSSGRVLLSQGMTLNPMFINRLKELGIPAVYIRDNFLAGREVQDVVSEKTRIETQQTVRSLFTEIHRNKRVDITAAKEAIKKLVDEVLSNRKVLVNLTDIRSFDDYLFAHCVNVSIMSLMIGVSMDYNELQLRDLGIGAVLHDTGKMMVNKNILDKPGQLAPSEKVQVQEHSQFGFEILREQRDLSLLSAHVAFQHHEKFDGTGYPRGLKGNDIHEFSRIVAVADVYDALTADRVYRKAYKPHEALGIISEGCGTHFDQDIVRIFTKKVAPYPVGTIVSLNTGETGVVVDNHHKDLSRPIIRLILTSQKQIIEELQEIDLRWHTNVEINLVLNDDNPLIPTINEMSMSLVF